MDTTFQKIPFLRITLAFAFGIILCYYFEYNTIIGVIFALLVAAVLIFLNKWYSYKIEPIFGSCILLLYLFLGSAFYSNHNTQIPFVQKSFSVATVLEKPQEKPNSYKSLLSISALQTQNTTVTRKEKTLVYFEKSPNAENLQAGDQILIKSSPTLISNFGTPYSFDYKAYLKNKRIYRQVYLKSADWKNTNLHSKNLFTYAELLREKLLQIYRNQNLGHNETEILSALTLGYKRDLEPETKRIFSAAGAMHILAVSGLHVGILFLIFSYLFGFLRLRKTGTYLFITTSILLLWSFAFITGLSPSVLRASTMFTILIIADNIQRKASIYNSLAASALFLLLLNPNNISEVGFQLSYAAVFGIVYLQPRLARLWPVKNKILKFFWNLLCVSLAAQIATFPLSAYYFNQFPVYFGLTNLIVIPAAMALIPLGIALLIFSKIPFLTLGIAFCIKWIIKLVYGLLQWIESLPYSTLDFSIHPIELLFLISFVFFTFYFIKNKRALPLKLALFSFLFFTVSILSENYRQHKSSELIVFNNASNISFQLIHGRKNYVISEQEIKTGDFLSRQIQDVTRKKRLTEPIFINSDEVFEDDFLYLKNGILYFNEKTILLENKQKNLVPNILPNYLITPNNFRFQKPDIKATTKVISTGYINSNSTNQQIHSLKTAGAFCEKW